MSIWVYEHRSSSLFTTREVLMNRQKLCSFCQARMPEVGSPQGGDMQVRTCPICGWWWVLGKCRFHTDNAGAYREHRCRGAIGTLKELDIRSPNAAIDEVRQYLAGRYDERHAVDPFVFQDVVESVYRSFGYRTRTSGKGPDKGIDIVLDGPNDTLIGVQVKRWKGKIRVHMIREFVGALVQAGHTRGVYVTTSEFTPAAEAAAAEFHGTPYPVDLVDAEGFLGALGVAQRREYGSAWDSTAPYAKASLEEMVFDKRWGHFT